MSVNPVVASTAILQLNSKPATPAVTKPATNASAIPQDKVTLSSAAQNKPAAPNGDVDHDGDNK
jgi:hypothetical protein